MVARLERWEGDETGKWEVPGSFKGGGLRMSPRFHRFVSDVNQGNKGAGWLQDFLAWPQRWKGSP